MLRDISMAVYQFTDPKAPNIHRPRNDPKTTKGHPKVTLFVTNGVCWLIGAGEAIRTPDPNLGKEWG